LNNFVTPAKAGAQSCRMQRFRPEIPAFAGMTDGDL